MTTLNMDLEIAEQAVRRMTEAYATLSDEAKKVRAQVYGVLQDGGNWMGYSAKEFYEKFNETDQCLHAVLEDFGQVGVVLRGEVDQWKAMQEKLK